LPQSQGTLFQTARAERPQKNRAVTASLLALSIVAVLATSWLPARADDAAPTPAAAPVPQISDAVKQSATLDQDDIKEIQSKVALIVQSLADGSHPNVQSADRVWLIAALSDSNGNPAGSDYLQQYATIFNQQMLAMVSAPNANFRAKIQAGLAAGAVAAKTGSSAVAPLAVKLLQDPSASVTLMGMKAAGGMVPGIFSGSSISPIESKLLDEIVGTVIRNPNPPLGGPIAEQAYLSLRQPVFAAINGSPSPLVDKVLVPLVLKLVEQRIALYKAGKLPESPQADSTGVVILLSPNVWQGLTRDQQHEALGAAADLISYSAQARDDQANDAASTSLVQALKTDGQELRLFSDPGRGPAPDQALSDGVAHLGSLGLGSGAEAIDKASTEAVNAIKDYLSRNQ